MSSTGSNTDPSDTFEIVNVAETVDAQKTVVDDITCPSVEKIDYDCKAPEFSPDTQTSSEDPLVICDQSAVEMDSGAKSEVVSGKGDVDMLTDGSKDKALEKSKEVPDLTKEFGEKTEDVDDECVISVDSDNSDLLDISDSSIDKGIISEETKTNIIKTVESYFDRFDSWIDELDLSLGWVPDLEEVPATKWLLDKLP